jgi:hypothetical protein
MANDVDSHDYDAIVAQAPDAADITWVFGYGASGPAVASRSMMLVVCRNSEERDVISR